MKITKINIPRSLPEMGIPNDGLQPIEMSHLGDVVILTGRNGAGKSRILRKIKSTINRKPNRDAMENLGAKIVHLNQQIASYKNAISIRLKEMPPSGDKMMADKNQIDSWQQQINNLDEEIVAIESTKVWSYIETDNLANNYTIVEFVPKKLDLKDCNALTPTELKNKALEADHLGINQLSETCLAKIKRTVEKHFNSTHQDSQVSIDEKQKAIREYDQLDELIHTFIGARLGRNIDGDTTLFGFPIGAAQLSDGQKVLLQLCVAIHAQGATLDNMILFLDEPENHMHPSVTIEFLDKLREKVPNGQIWMATHSIPLIAHFGAESVWYVDNGKVSYAGKEQEKVLAGLLGDENEIAKLNDLINLPAAMAINNFALECLSNPAVVMTEARDPQAAQMELILMEKLRQGNVKLLDYGAGKGRFLSNFFDRLSNEDKEMVRGNFEYVAFDKYDSDKIDCCKNIERVYGSADRKYYTTTNSLLSEHDAGSFDIVLMCNVLHEIDPKDWLSLFISGGYITRLLNPETGLLLHVEDMLLPNGEKAYRNGFVILDTPQIKALFNLKDKDFSYHISRNERYGDRLKAHLIPVKCLHNITAETRNEALINIQQIAREEIRRLREQNDANYQNGKKHAFWTQQFANSSLSIEELSQ